MKARMKILGAVLICLLPLPGFAMTGHDVYEKCTASVQQPPASESTQKAITRFLDAGTCAGFVGGVLSGVNLVGEMMRQQNIIKRNFVCLPENKHSQILLKELLEYLQANTEDRDLPAQLVIYKVFSQKYPCQEASAD